jgi:hypothetical protein
MTSGGQAETLEASLSRKAAGTLGNQVKIRFGRRCGARLTSGDDIAVCFPRARHETFVRAEPVLADLAHRRVEVPSGTSLAKRERAEVLSSRESGQEPLLQSVASLRRNRSCGAIMHERNHRRGGARLRLRVQHLRHLCKSRTGPAELDWHQQTEHAGFAERCNVFRAGSDATGRSGQHWRAAFPGKAFRLPRREIEDQPCVPRSMKAN